ncbi:MAG: metal-dependent hydrolase [Planctomycetaceae bacterium]
MSVQLTWLGHASWLLELEGKRIVLDPFLENSPTSTSKPDQIQADYVLVSHGHFDHVQDAAAIANRCSATVITNYEIALWLQKTQGVQSAVGMNIGGGIELPFGRLQMTPAIHSSSLPDGSNGGNPCGFLIRSLSGFTIYFACDTALFSDMQLIGRKGIDVAVVPIGDLFTMGPDDALEAVKYISPKTVLPSHFDTWPPIAQNAAAWAACVSQETSARGLVPKVGQPILLK